MVESINDLREGALYRLPTGLIVQAWSKNAPWRIERVESDPAYLPWWLGTHDRAYVIWPILENGQWNARGEIRLFSTKDDPGGRSFPELGVPTPFTVVDLEPLGAP